MFGGVYLFFIIERLLRFAMVIRQVCSLIARSMVYKGHPSLRYLMQWDNMDILISSHFVLASNIQEF